MNALVSLRRAVGALVVVVAVGAASVMPDAARAAGPGVPLDRFPQSKLTDLPSLQDGARTFVNSCLNCHSATLMRYNRLRDIGLTEEQIASNLLFTGGRVGDTMQISMRGADAREWFGAMPPDLSVIARARSSAAGSGSDWLYTFLRGYYRDDTRVTGWNNTVFANVGMPHVLWEWQGSRGAAMEEVKATKDEQSGKVLGWNRTVVAFDPDGRRTERTEKIQGSEFQHESTRITLTPARGGTMNPAVYDDKVANLVAYITYMSDPTAKTRTRMGLWVLLFLSLLVFTTWWLNREYWKDIK